MSQEIITREESTDLVDAELFSPASIFDIERFEQVMRVASVMARNTTLPNHLRSEAKDPNIAYEETRGNCFMICNQAANWGMDPFAVAQATSFLYGKLVLEGKLVRAVINQKLGFSLNYAFFGSAGDMKRRVYVSDKPLVDKDGKSLSEDQIKELKENHSSGFKITDGTLQKWHTKNKSGGVNDNWAKDEDKMFRERGAREWCREHKPGLMLGVYTPDEFDEVEHTARSMRAKDITYNPLLESNSTAPMERVDTSTGEIIETKTTESSSAVAFPAADDGSGAGTDKAVDAAPANSSGPNASKASDEKAVERETPPARSTAADHALSAAQLIQAAKFLARQDTEEKINKAAASIKAGSDSMPAPNDADLRLLAAFKAVVIKCINDGVSTADELDIFSSVVDGIFSGDVND